MVIQSPEIIGRKVRYTMPHGETKEGIVSSYNSHWIFVRYTSGDTAAATNPKDLELI